MKKVKEYIEEIRFAKQIASEILKQDKEVVDLFLKLEEDKKKYGIVIALEEYETEYKIEALKILKQAPTQKKAFYIAEILTDPDFINNNKSLNYARLINTIICDDIPTPTKTRKLTKDNK